MTHLSVKRNQMEADISTQAVGLASSADFSLMNLFIRADIIVKTVIIILIACSVYSWAVIIEKFRLFKKINHSLEKDNRLNFTSRLVLVPCPNSTGKESEVAKTDKEPKTSKKSCSCC